MRININSIFIKYWNVWIIGAFILKYTFNIKQVKFLNYIITLIGIVIDLI